MNQHLVQQSELINLFHEHLSTLQSLREQATREIVFDIDAHIELSQEDKEWVVDYLQDIGSLFRMLKRQKFIASFTYESLRNSVLWRMTTLKPIVSYDALHRPSSSTPPCSPPGLPALRFLPLDKTDVFGRPIIVLRASELDLSKDLEQLKREITLSSERMRISLQRLAGTMCRGRFEGPSLVFQYCIIIDVEDISMKSIPIELIKWYLKTLQPWYYGVVGTIIIINYSWVHSGIWTVLKHLLPSSAISKFVFLEKDELGQYMTDSCRSTILSSLRDTKHPDTAHLDTADTQLSLPMASGSLSRSRASSMSSSFPSKTSKPPGAPDRRRKKQINRFSLDNPFFGYPIDSTITKSQQEFSLNKSNDRDLQSYSTLQASASIPSLRYGRRRKRDLARALLIMYWQRWGLQLGIGAVLIILVGLLRVRRYTFRNVSLLGAALLSRVKVWTLTRRLF